MREIKFRAWAMGKMWECTKIDFEKESFEVKNSTSNEVFYCGSYPKFMQFTGLKDKNGVEIYEGDMVRSKCCDDCKMPIKILKVIFHEGCFELRYVKAKDWEYSDLYSLLSGAGNIEVIGNIYQNHELLND